MQAFVKKLWLTKKRRRRTKGTFCGGNTQLNERLGEPVALQHTSEAHFALAGLCFMFFEHPISHVQAAILKLLHPYVDPEC